MSEPPASDSFHVGVIGCGALGRHIAEQFRAEPTASIAAIADVSDAARSEAGEALDVQPADRYEDYAAMLESADLDGVVIATPHALHHEQVAAALDAGLHVLCEKPLVLTVEDAVDLRDRAAAADRTLMVGYQRHLDQAFVRARERYQGGAADDGAAVDSPEIGHVTAEITQPWFDIAPGTWRADPDLSGGGFTVDTGRHVIDALLWVTGLDPVAVDAEMAFRSPGIDERAEIRIEFEGGATAHVSFYGDAQTVREAHHVVDSEGAVEIDGLGWGSRDMRTIDDEETVHEPLLDRGAEPTKAEAFLDAVRSGDAPPATVEDAIRATAVVEAAYESAESGEAVAVSLPASPDED
ncbi:oxidoreductase domain-containing protein [Salinarchaeum sp. Harcht-Bsk1]|uniref:Gfo/Idh/MocA family protein n=1 Tax=Salinarchaeum sp. Harcht-Bsk1 TaxID=1333523 RepID=UPI0003423CDB|nr:Gfo/Idh/MocA family oxidoreductase [Salinarchaeum sp. Harcht-Bsk1]AGN01316.1 oxidoreductase domain-containing protein [Salinarchaeum sp. Harcht-Bsk1]